MSDVGIRVASIYYPELKRRLLQRKALVMPWHTETDPHDPVNAGLDQEAYRGHRDGSLIDMAATELPWATARRRVSMVAGGKIIGYRLAADIPARVNVLARLTGLPALPATLVPQGALFGTEGDADTSSIVFEASEDLAPASTAFVVYWDATNKHLYVGHRTLKFAGLAFSAAGYGTGRTYATQYWDGIARAWTSIAGAVDGTAHLTHSGTITWPVTTPDDSTHEWSKTTPTAVPGAIEAFWVRIAGASTAGSDPTTPAAVVSGFWYAWIPCVQGETVTDILGTTASGAAWQKFYLQKSPFIDGSLDQVAVGTDLSWVRAAADSFYLAGPADKVYVIGEDATGYFVKFGDGLTGALPPDGSQVEARYRVGAADDGNVGPATVTVNRSSIARLADISNPAAATGWIAAEASTPESLERTREIAPATARANGRAVTLEDHETLAVQWTSADGRKPVARAYAIKNGAGPRSVRLLVVGAAGADLLVDDIDALDEYYNGVLRGTQRVGGVCFENSTAVVQNYTGLAVTVAYTIRVLRTYASGAKAASEAAIAAALGPLVLESGGAAWAYYPGGTVGIDRLKGAGVAAVPGFVDYTSFTLNGGTSDLTLGAYNLPNDGIPSGGVVPATVIATVVEV